MAVNQNDHRYYSPRPNTTFQHRKAKDDFNDDEQRIFHEERRARVAYLRDVAMYSETCTLADLLAWDSANLLTPQGEVYYAMLQAEIENYERAVNGDDPINWIAAAAIGVMILLAVIGANWPAIAHAFAGMGWGKQ